MNWKWLILLLVLVRHGYDFVLDAVRAKSCLNKTPDALHDVYDSETYDKWKRYSGEKCRLHVVNTVISLVVTAVLLVFNVHAHVAALFGANVYLQGLVVVLFQALVDTVCAIAPNYWDDFKIEEKYGFNRTKGKTFVMDQVRSFLIEAVLNSLLVCVLCLLHQKMGDWVVLLFTGVMFLLTLVMSFLSPFLMRMGNKFVPLEEGELRDKLTALLTKHGYTVKEIQVMDASRRTTKLNAAFTGMGKTKTIVLYDNLLNAMTPDEICAVFAHELGHGLHKDITKLQLMNLVNLLLMAVLAWVCVRTPQMHQAFGFAGVNYGFAYVLLSAFLALLQPLTGMGMNAFSRMVEFRADRQAVEEGYGEGLVTALKVLARENFAHLSPARLLVVLEYSHPPLGDRIDAIKKALQK